MFGVSLYTMSPDLVAEMGAELTRYEVAGSSTIHFTPDKPLPAKLIRKIVRARLREKKQSPLGPPNQAESG